MREKDLFVIRHGKTPLNFEGRALGASDPDLSEEGRMEVKELVYHLRDNDVSPQTIYTSPLKRSRETAEILQESLGGNLIEDPLLREVDYGSYEGGSRETLREIDYGYNIQKMKEGQGETVEEVEKRASAFLRNILDTNDNSILVITHAFTASVITQLMMNVPRTFDTIQALPTASYNYFRVGKGGENSFSVLTTQRNCFKAPLDI